MATGDSTQPTLYETGSLLLKCSRCKQKKPLTEFPMRKKRPAKFRRPGQPRSRYGRSDLCLDCDRRRKRDVHFRVTYGTSLEEYERRLATQGGGCAICGGQETVNTRPRSQVGMYLSQDHDHRTGVNRGLLCYACNRGLGSFRDDPALLRKAAAYVESYRETVS